MSWHVQNGPNRTPVNVGGLNAQTYPSGQQLTARTYQMDPTHATPINPWREMVRRTHEGKAGATSFPTERHYRSATDPFNQRRQSLRPEVQPPQILDRPRRSTSCPSLDQRRQSLRPEVQAAPPLHQHQLTQYTTNLSPSNQRRQSLRPEVQPPQILDRPRRSTSCPSLDQRRQSLQPGVQALQPRQLSSNQVYSSVDLGIQHDPIKKIELSNSLVAGSPVFVHLEGNEATDLNISITLTHTLKGTYIQEARPFSVSRAKYSIMDDGLPAFSCVVHSPKHLRNGLTTGLHPLLDDRDGKVTGYLYVSVDPSGPGAVIERDEDLHNPEFKERMDQWAHSSASGFKAAEPVFMQVNDYREINTLQDGFCQQYPDAREVMMVPLAIDALYNQGPGSRPTFTRGEIGVRKRVYAAYISTNTDQPPEYRGTLVKELNNKTFEVVYVDGAPEYRDGVLNYLVGPKHLEFKNPAGHELFICTGSQVKKIRQKL